MKTATKQKKVSPRSVGPTRRPLPKGWRQVVGILKGRREDLEAHVKQVRSEWDQSFQL